MERPQPEPLTPSSSDLSPHRHFERSRPTFSSSSDLSPPRHFERSRPTFFSSSDLPAHRHFERSRPTFSSASDLSPHRHFERSRPTFSSAFAPANASACAERNLSSLRSLYAPPPRAGASPLERKHSEEKNGETRTARRPTPRAPLL